MHTLEFDSQTEHAITPPDIGSGQSPDELLRDLMMSSIKNQSIQSNPIKTDSTLPDLRHWDAFFDTVREISRQRQVASELTLTRDDIDADRFH